MHVPPTEVPNKLPSASPSESPTKTPSTSPSQSPSESPTAEPVAVTTPPTALATNSPTPTPLGGIRGTVFEDRNNNGVQDPGEPGIEGVSVANVDSAGRPFTLTTDVNGKYFQQGVHVGSTVIVIVEGAFPPSFVQTVGTNPTTVNVPVSEYATDNDGYVLSVCCP